MSEPRIVVLADRPTATSRLYALPPNAFPPQFFLSWIDFVPPSIELCSVLLPGRDDLTGHACVTDPADMAKMLADLFSNDGRPFGLFGHSLGALLAFATTAQLRRDGRHAPDLLAVSGMTAPHLGLGLDVAHGLIAKGWSTPGNASTRTRSTQVSSRTFRSLVTACSCCSIGTALNTRWTANFSCSAVRTTRSRHRTASPPGASWWSPRSSRASSMAATTTS